MTEHETGRRGFHRGLDLTGIVDERFADRFWSKVDPSGNCWEWTAYRKPSGYGQFTVRKGQFYTASAVCYALVNGPIPPGYVVCHHCDNPPCVRPDHLFLGTQADNTRDMVRKGRASRTRGTERSNARLTDDDVRLIRSAESYWGINNDLAARFGVSNTTIRRVRAGSKWRHVA